MSFEDVPPDPEKGGAPGHDSRRSTNPNNTKAIRNYHDTTTSWRLGSQAVSWWEVHLWRDRMLTQLGVQQFPMVGTPAWCALDDDHPEKIAAVFDAAQHWALRVDTAQEELAAASKAVAAAAAWTAIAKANRDRAEFYERRPFLRRVATDANVVDAPHDMTTTTLATATDANVVDAPHDLTTTTLATATDANDMGRSARDASTTLAAAANTWARRVIV
ncbi:DUF2742 domain-containing protein [Mycobacterium palustre]|uniref:DUF2742 domain-containing protein n=1 Tax=Mycobacterium palustre TaxID=153971 RepID=UPI000A16B48C|nr:DUF2742 domain-containing protein [Mycobacterium palustre]